MSSGSIREQSREEMILDWFGSLDSESILSKYESGKTTLYLGWLIWGLEEEEAIRLQLLRELRAVNLEWRSALNSQFFFPFDAKVDKTRINLRIESAKEKNDEAIRLAKREFDKEALAAWKSLLPVKKEIDDRYKEALMAVLRQIETHG